MGEYIKNKLYFATLAAGRREARSTSDIHFFSTDNELVYNNFYNDFGPLNLACLYKYCCTVNEKLTSPTNWKKQIVHYTSQNQQKRANAAFLIACYAILYLKKSPKEAYKPLIVANGHPLRPFQDASMGVSIYNIKLLDCLNAIHKAAAFGFFNFDDFDLAEYEKYEQMRNGDLNWMVPQKFLAFVGPSTELGSVYHPPERYLEYFQKNNVIAVVRLNKKSYEASRFTRAGITHYDMFMPDGSVPPKRVLDYFLRLAETTVGPIAVHCKAGLGRTGSLIAAYLVKHYRMSAKEAIAWMRICRPGSVIGHQQAWLEDMESMLWREGQQYRLKYHGDGDMILHHKRGIYSMAKKVEKQLDQAHGTNRFDATHFNKLLVENNSGNTTDLELPVIAEQRRHNVALTRTSKPGLASILGKLCTVGGSTPFNSDKNSQIGRKGASDAVNYKSKNNGNLHCLTQGDRLNEIKINRNKLSVNSLLFSRNNVAPPPQSNSAKRLQRRK
ncbi:dual specificity protein phosphatase CDC14C-like [Neodiprion virginianus]|uniref:dual specificity protein phosphatase CDC14C-like n=1 Tax=Neodiprion virginianus TaxID=2961670 RepID=UPI001EE75D25|nr:dual specificity protein phosphatase CDC14C-like [Neodiprion virginianus]